MLVKILIEMWNNEIQQILKVLINLHNLSFAKKTMFLQGPDILFMLYVNVPVV